MCINSGPVRRCAVLIDDEMFERQWVRTRAGVDRATALGRLAHPELFEQPRTYVVEGIKFGMQASQGSLEWADDAKVCERIRALAASGDITADQVELLVTVTQKPMASAIRQLSPKLRRRIGVRLEGDGDQPLIKSVDSTIEKAVTSVINAAIKEAQAEGV